MSETYELTGKLIADNGTQEVGSNGFTKREFVVEIDGDTDYPQAIKLELVKGNCAKLDGVAVGSTVKVGFNLRGRFGNDKYFTNLTAWKLDVVGASAPAQADPGGDYSEVDDPSVPF